MEILKKTLAVFAAAVIAAGCASPDQSSPTVGPISPVPVTPAAAPSPSDSPSAPPTAAPSTTPPTTQAPPPPPATTAAVVQGKTGSGSGSGSTSGSCGADYYRNSDGVCVHRPVSGPGAPPGATAKCKDGTYSFSKHRQGTCSGHGGVAEWL